MKIELLNGTPLEAKEYNLFERISNELNDGFVVRNFLNKDETTALKEIFSENKDLSYKIIDGLRMLPRSFEYVLKEDKEQYQRELDFFNNDASINKLRDTIHQKLSDLVGNSELEYASEENNYSYSNAWSSFRELLPGKILELHCGNAFKHFSKEFFDKQYMQMETTHLSYFVMLQKPQSDDDIVIYKKPFNELPDRIGTEAFRDSEGNVINKSDVPAYHIKLNEGDMLLFNECQFWHEVILPPGNIIRITFGAFISKYKEMSKYLMWT